MTSELFDRLPLDWREAIMTRVDPGVAAALEKFVLDEYTTGEVFPTIDDLFNAFRACSLADTKVLILGQDPYHKRGQAHGLSFSVRPGVAVPPSLRNVYRELRDDLGVEPPPNGDLTGWAEQGVLLLNAVLTVRAGAPASHAGRGWEEITDAAIRALNERATRVMFVLWGSYARRKAELVTNPVHVLIEAGHPSPMNPKGFLGSRPFSAISSALAEVGAAPIDWSRVGRSGS